MPYGFASAHVAEARRLQRNILRPAESLVADASSRKAIASMATRQKAGPSLARTGLGGLPRTAVLTRRTLATVDMEGGG